MTDKVFIWYRFFSKLDREGTFKVNRKHLHVIFILKETKILPEKYKQFNKNMSCEISFWRHRNSTVGKLVCLAQADSG